MNSAIDETSVAAALQKAIDRRELFMLYQPKICVRSGALVGLEAVMRWQSRELGMVVPSSFIPIAERCGAIDELTIWGLRQVLKQWCSWREQGLITKIAFNISAISLRDPKFPDIIERECRVAGMPCDQLILEVTESVTLHLVQLLETITRFRIKGIEVELDDFGTGFSSLLQLRQLPYTGLKVDIRFVQDIVTDPEARLIVKSVIDLARGMGLVSTAEGVESQETLNILQLLRCDHAQGYFIAPPLRSGELIPWLVGAGGRRRLSRLLERAEAAPVH